MGNWTGSPASPADRRAARGANPARRNSNAGLCSVDPDEKCRMGDLGGDVLELAL
jgi:hypothetical protein